MTRRTPNSPASESETGKRVQEFVFTGGRE